jgi:poly(hydroxyalkanoate) depolymerase family esterase
MFARLRERIGGWFRRTFGREPAPGRFEADAKFAWRGFLATAPFVWPSREYLVYVPRGYSRWRRAPLLVLIHGCKQTPEEIAQGTRIAALADRHGFIVLLPRQKDEANAWRCWNWFDQRVADGAGEAAIVAAQIEAVRKTYRADPRRVVVAGMSSGGALAAVMGVRYPGLVTAVASHSGIACGAAASPMSAMGVTQTGPDANVEAVGRAARMNAPGRKLPVPLLVIHGDADRVVNPRNAVALVRQYLHLNGHPSVATGSPGAGDRDGSLPEPDDRRETTQPDGRVCVESEWRVDGRLVARYIAIRELGHAWSGGDGSLPYNDAHAPDATALIGAFALGTDKDAAKKAGKELTKGATADARR